MYRTAPRKQNEPTSKIVILTSLRFLPAYLSGSPRWYQIHTSYSCSTLSLLPHILPRLSFLVQTAGIYQFPSPYLEIIHCYNNNTSGILSFEIPIRNVSDNFLHRNFIDYHHCELDLQMEESQVQWSPPTWFNGLATPWGDSSVLCSQHIFWCSSFCPGQDEEVIL